MIKKYNFEGYITKKHQQQAIKKINNLFNKGEWCKEISEFPAYQTWNIYNENELKIFSETFIKSCELYKEKHIDIEAINMWCYMDHLRNPYKKNNSTSWHNHKRGSKDLELCGIYYLKNPRNVPTLFKSIKVFKPEPFTWYIFPSHLNHKPDKVKSWRKRYTLGADLYESII